MKGKAVGKLKAPWPLLLGPSVDCPEILAGLYTE